MSQINKIAYLENESIKISRGQVKGVIPVHKFGAVNSLSTSTTGTIWDVNDTIYPWESWSTATFPVVSSTSASDVGKKITIVGLDGNYNLVEAEVTLTAQNGNTNTQNFIRIFRAYVSSGTTNVGNINITVSNVVVCRITAGYGQTLMTVYTIPAGYTGYLYKGTCSAQSGADGTGNMFVRYYGQSSFRIAHTFEVVGSGAQYEYTFSFPPEIPEKSDIDVRITTRSNNGRYTSAFDLLLVKNPN